jgi:hypothetical protein
VVYIERINNLDVMKPGECRDDEMQSQDTTLKIGSLRQGGVTNENETIKEDFQHSFT